MNIPKDVLAESIALLILFVAVGRHAYVNGLAKGKDEPMPGFVPASAYVVLCFVIAVLLTVGRC